MRIAKVITLTDEERVAAAGRRNDEIVAELKCTRRTVGT